MSAINSVVKRVEPSVCVLSGSAAVLPAESAGRVVCASLKVSIAPVAGSASCVSPRRAGSAGRPQAALRRSCGSPRCRTWAPCTYPACREAPAGPADKTSPAIQGIRATPNIGTAPSRVSTPHPGNGRRLTRSNMPGPTALKSTLRSYALGLARSR